MPQDSTWAPLLFLIYINDLPNALIFYTILFADDTCILLNHRDPQILENLCNEELERIDQWFKANILTANLAKASTFMITPGGYYIT